MSVDNERKTMISGTTVCSFLVPVLSLLFASQSMAQSASEATIGEMEAAGTFAPAGPPLEQPVRVDAGGSCVIDLRQAYDVSGTLSGSLEIDYRIIVYSPCDTAVPGKYDEEWIAHGVFAGMIDGAGKSGSLTYTAQARAGGDVEGRILFGGDIGGELAVSGNFGDGELLTEEQYRELQKLGDFDTKTSSWVKTPSDIRRLGGALFCDRRYGKVFVYHNGAQSYYSSRGFRGWLRM